MKRFLTRIVVMSVMAAPLVLAVGVPAAHASRTCPPDISNTTVNDSVFVPAGQSCTIQSSTVTGNVYVSPGATLLVLASKINGSVNASRPNGVAFDCLAAPPNCTSVVIGGDVNIDGTTSIPAGLPINFMCATQISGRLNITNSGAGAQWSVGLCNPGPTPAVTIGGNVTLNQNHAMVTFDDNTANSSVTASYNTGGGELARNTIGGALTVLHNNPCWNVNTNTVAGASTVHCP